MGCTTRGFVRVHKIAGLSGFVKFVVSSKFVKFQMCGFVKVGESW